jgi:hypothetical protein
MHQSRPVLAYALVAVLAACSGKPAGSSDAGVPAGQDVTVEVHPSSAWVKPGGTVDFSTTVTGTADTSVEWSVLESGGGTVSASGTYSAPLTSGTYTITASNGKGKALGHSKVTVGPTPTVSISPSAPTVTAGSSLAFTATVTGTTSVAVTWSVREGAACGTIDAAGLYTAPLAGATCHVDVASVESPTATASATVTVSPPPAPAPTPVVVSISPSSGTVDACRTLTFTATVTGAAGGITWSVQEGSAGGSVSSSGVYTAPATAGTYHLVATSQAVPSSSATVAVTVSDRILGVAVSPSTLSLAPGGTAQFTATVTTSCGSFSTTQTVTAPN